jgi:hypothetical protein
VPSNRIRSLGKRSGTPSLIWRAFGVRSLQLIVDVMAGRLVIALIALSELFIVASHWLASRRPINQSCRQ